MKTRKFLAFALALIMAFAMIPVASLAENVDGLVNEAAAMRKLDNAWAALDAAEADALAQGMSRTEVINAVYTAALNLNTVDKDSFSDFTKDGFYFTVDGMYCAYNYRLRNELNTDCAPVEEGVVLTKGNGKKSALKDAESPNVFLVAPYYGHDSSFTDQYKREAQSIAAATGGEYLLIQSTSATGPAIAENFVDKGVVFFDSHGTQSGTSSYLCLTTNSGITQEDYNNGWAVRSGSAAFIDGRYIEHHTPDTLSNCLVWMAICEGMKRQGQGTTGYALLRAGAGVVYGYSQSVTFVGDYMYEETFWNAMKNADDPATVADAFNLMAETHGLPEPRGDAWPIVMSEDDPFPANPDSAQTVNSQWTLFGNPEPVDITGFSLQQNAVEMYIGRTAEINFVRQPENANNYELVWTSSNESVATVTGNKRKATVTGISAGTATITCTVMVNGSVFGTATCEATVNIDTSLFDSLNVAGGSLQFGTSQPYGFEAVTEGDRFLAKSNNAGVGNSTASVSTTVQMSAGDTLTFDYFYSSESNYDWYRFKANGTEVQKLSGNTNSAWATYTYTAAADGAYTFEWSYSKDNSVNRGEDCVKIDNVAFSGDAGMADGDVDGDGIVSVSDALLAMRGAMGTITLTASQLAHADLDGDGTVTASDALAIMRMAMNG